MWNLPRPGPEPVSLAVTGGFLTAEPPRKPNDGVGVYVCVCLTGKISISTNDESANTKTSVEKGPDEVAHTCV